MFRYFVLRQSNIRNEGKINLNQVNFVFFSVLENLANNIKISIYTVK